MEEVSEFPVCGQHVIMNDNRAFRAQYLTETQRLATSRARLYRFTLNQPILRKLLARNMEANVKIKG